MRGWLVLAVSLMAAAPASAQESAAGAPRSDPGAETSPPDSSREGGATPRVVGPELRPAPVRFRSGSLPVDVVYVPDIALDEDASGALVVRRYPESAYQLLCRTPCDRHLPQGHYALGVRRDGELTRFEEPLGIDGPSGVRVAWNSGADARLAGTLLLALGVPFFSLAAVLLPVVDLATSPASVIDALGITGLVAGGAGTIASLALGLFFVGTEDGVSFSVTPLPADASGLFSSDWR